MGNSKTRGLTADELEEEKSLKLKAKSLEKEHKKLKEEDQLVQKALLLGAGESGKSTLFKQIQLNYGSGFKNYVYSEHTTIIQRNLMEIFKTLLLEAKKYAKKDSSYVISSSHSPKLIAAIKAFDFDYFASAEASQIDAFLSDTAIRRTLERRNQFQLIDTADYLLSRRDVILSEDYVPTVEDILRARKRTTGIIEMSFEVSKLQTLLVVDVGGQRNERKKWIRCFDNVDNIIFVASLSGYNQAVFEERTRNRLDEALELFTSVVENPAFKNTSIILLLNKMDLFAEKLKLFPLNTKFPEYRGDNSPEDAARFIRKLFTEKNMNKVPLVSQFTTATDIDNMKKLLKGLKSNFIQGNAKNRGLV